MSGLLSYEQVLDCVDNVKRNGWRASGRCPAHPDENNSLAISAGDEGRVLLFCFAGCTFEEIMAAILAVWEKTRGEQEEDDDRATAEQEESDGLTLETYAREKRLPEAFLRKFVVETTHLSGRPALRIPYFDENLNEVAVRFRLAMKGKEKFKWRTGSKLYLYGLWRLKKMRGAGYIVLPEGESDCHTLWLHKFPALGIPGANSWKEEWAETLEGIPVIYVVIEPDRGGEAVLKWLANSPIRHRARLVHLKGAKDPSELYLADPDNFKAAFKAALEAATPWKAGAATAGPWAGIESMATFLSGDDDDAEFLDDGNRFLARQCIAEVFSPRGLGKTLFALWLAILLVMRGLRVLYMDRDNPKRVTRARLSRFGAKAEMKNLNVVTRENCPPLTDSKRWASFPYADYDVIILDSLDSAAEGVGEQDSGKPSKAIAPLLDIARRENGPAVLVLGNTVRSGQHSRGSGVIEDRGDIVYEVRDATDFHPSGQKPWVEELPPADASSWALRSSRRKQRERYRLAFISTKFRIGPEPDPFVLEIDTTPEVWTVEDVTDEVDREGAEVRAQRARAKVESIEKAVAALVTEITRRNAAKEPALLKKQAEEFLTHLAGLKITQKEAREITKSKTFELVSVSGKGHSKAVQLAGKIRRQPK